MKKYIFTIAFCFLCTAFSEAQNMRTVFSRIPEQVCMLCDSIQRLDLMDSYQAGTTNQIKNKLNEVCILNDFSENYLSLQISNFKMEIILLPMINESKIIGVIHTTCAPVCDSHLSFYTTDWKPLDDKIFFSPVNISWFFKDSTNLNDPKFIEVNSMLDMNLTEFRFDKEQNTIIQYYNTPQYLSKEIKEEIKLFLKNTGKVHHWNKIRFD